MPNHRHSRRGSGFWSWVTRKQVWLEAALLLGFVALAVYCGSWLMYILGKLLGRI